MAGHRRLGFIGGAAQGDAARARLRGVREVAALAGLPEVRVLFGDYRSVDAEAMRALLLAPDAPTGLVACSDLIAAWLLTELPRWGFAVPRDVSVVGYDDEVLTPYLNPPLTTVRQDGLDEGRMAAELLIRLIEKEPVEQRFITLAPQLIERASVAPPPAKREREA